MPKAKGYYTNYGYVGYINGNPMLFASEAEYLDYLDQATIHLGCASVIIHYAYTNVKPKRTIKGFIFMQ